MPYQGGPDAGEFLTNLLADPNSCTVLVVVKRHSGAVAVAGLGCDCNDEDTGNDAMVAILRRAITTMRSSRTITVADYREGQ